MRQFAFLACCLWAAVPAWAGEEPTIVRIVAERFTYSPASIHVKQGTVVEIRLRSEDTNHGFKISKKGVNVVIPKRGKGEATVRFDASEPGRYVFECSKPCGAGHTIMRGEIIVD